MLFDGFLTTTGACGYGSRSPGGQPWGSPQIHLLEEIIALVIDDDEGRKILDFDAPDRLHAEFGIFHHLDLLDAVFGEIGRRPADRAEIEAAVLLAGLAHRDRAIALGDHHHRAAGRLELIDKRI